MPEIKLKKWTTIALSWFLMVALIGVLMRYATISDLPLFEYKHLLHGHSHVALLGWVYTALYVGVVYTFVPTRVLHYQKLFWYTQICILGMFLSFPFQGYALFSISFSTLYLFTSYGFIFKILKDIKRSKTTIAIRYLKAGLFYLAFSSIGPWLLGPLMASGYKHQPIYFNTIYFFLHFLYNGFIVMTILAFIYHYREQYITKPDMHKPRKLGPFHITDFTVFRLLHWSILPSYILSTYWQYSDRTVPTVLTIVGSFSMILLSLATLLMIRDVKAVIDLFKLRHKRWITYTLYFSVLAYILKIVFQILSSIPSVSIMITSHSKYLVIGYLHLVLLGFASLFIISWLLSKQLVIANNWTKTGTMILISGILSSEGLLFYNGASAWVDIKIIQHFHSLLFYASSLMPVGISLILIGQFYKKK